MAEIQSANKDSCSAVNFWACANSLLNPIRLEMPGLSPTVKVVIESRRGGGGSGNTTAAGVVKRAETHCTKSCREQGSE